MSCAQGISDISNKSKVTTDDFFQIGSVTKTFVSALVLLQVHESKLGLDETIQETVEKYGQWLPKAAEKKWGRITLRQLLNMTSGIYSFTESSKFNKMWQAHPKKAWEPEEIIDIALSQPSYFQPGKGYHYSDTNYYLLGLLLEKITGQSLAKQIGSRLLNPLNITDIVYLPHKYSDTELKKMSRGYGKNLIDRTDVNMSQAGAAGAMIARPSSLAKWLRALFSGKVIPPKMLDEMLQPYSKKTGQLTNDPKEDAYGLGIFRSYYPNHGGPNWVYLGGTWGYSTCYQWSPQNDILFVLSVNIGMAFEGKQKKSAGWEIVHEFAPALYNEIAKKEG